MELRRIGRCGAHNYRTCNPAKSPCFFRISSYHNTTLAFALDLGGRELPAAKYKTF